MRTLRFLKSLWPTMNKEPFQTGFLFPVYLFLVVLNLAIDLLMLCIRDIPVGIFKIIGRSIHNRKKREANEIRRQQFEQEQILLEQKRLVQQRRQSEITQQQASDQARRTEARAQCELLYSRYMNEISSRFPKSMLDSFMKTYMNDSQPVDAVERRGKELQRTIVQHRELAKPTKKFLSIQELTQWFVEEKKHIESLPVDEELRQEHLVQLNMRYSDLTQKLLQTLGPALTG